MIGPDAPLSNNPNPQEWGTIRKIGLNTTWLTVARLGSQVFLLIFSMVVARRMGESGLGAYAYLAAIIYIANVLTTFGTDMLVMRAVAAHRDFSWLAPATVLQLILSSLFILLVFQLSPRLAGQEAELIAALRLYSLALFPLAVYTVCSALLRGLERMAPVMWLNLLLAALQAALAAWLIHPESSILTLSWVLLAVQSTVAIVSFFYCRLRVPGFTLGTGFDRRVLIQLIVASFPLASVAFVKILYQKITVPVLSHYQGLDATGWFTASLRMVEASQFIHIAMLGAVFPVMAFASLRQNDASAQPDRVLATSWKLLLALGIAVAAVLFLFATPIITLIYGTGFLPSIFALQILAWLMVPYSANLYLSALLISVRQEKHLLMVLFLSLVLLIILDFSLIPSFGLAGACVATLVAEAVQAVLFIATKFSLKLSG